MGTWFLFEIISIKKRTLFIIYLSLLVLYIVSMSSPMHLYACYALAPFLIYFMLDVSFQLTPLTLATFHCFSFSIYTFYYRLDVAVYMCIIS